MAMRAVQIIAAGQAGLKSLPYFIDEFISMEIPMIEPYAIDHSSEQIAELQLETMAKIKDQGPWATNIYSMGDSIGVTLEASDTEVRDAVQAINPQVDVDQNIADAPAYIAAAIRRKIPDICENTLNKWRSFKADNGIGDDAHLAVVIPYCPEGPTSGTAGAMIGAALRRRFRERDMGSQVTIWGIELCPPLTDATGAIDSGNIFRGYLARDEICNQGGVAIKREVNKIKKLTKPFDINLVIDAGKVQESAGPKNRQEMHEALDLIAAQTTAIMLKGPLGDAEETRALLQTRGGRWNGLAVHVVSSRTWDTCSKYWRYRSHLPWIKGNANWEACSLSQKRDAYVASTEVIRKLMANETDQECTTTYKSVCDRARQIRRPKLTRNKFTTFMLCLPTLGMYLPMENKKLKQNQERVENAMGRIIAAEQQDYDDMIDATRQERETQVGDQRPPVTYRKDLFCVNTVLNEAMQRSAAMNETEDGNPMPLAKIVGSVGAETIQQRILEQVNHPLERNKREGDPANQRSSAYYDRILAVWATPADHEDNSDMAPSDDSVKYLLSQDNRDDMKNYTGAGYRHRKTPMWRLQVPGRNGQKTQMVPVEMTYVILAQPKKNDGFKDVSTYDILLENYNSQIDAKNFKEIARYYTGLLPESAGGNTPEPEPALQGEDL